MKRYILLISFLTCGNVSCKKDNGGVQPWRNTQKADAPEEIGPGVYRHITPALMRRGELDEGPSSSDIRLGQVDIDIKGKNVYLLMLFRNFNSNVIELGQFNQLARLRGGMWEYEVTDAPFGGDGEIAVLSDNKIYEADSSGSPSSGGEELTISSFNGKKWTYEGSAVAGISAGFQIGEALVDKKGAVHVLHAAYVRGPYYTTNDTGTWTSFPLDFNPSDMVLDRAGNAVLISGIPANILYYRTPDGFRQEIPGELMLGNTELVFDSANAPHILGIEDADYPHRYLAHCHKNDAGEWTRERLIEFNDELTPTIPLTVVIDSKNNIHFAFATGRHYIDIAVREVFCPAFFTMEFCGRMTDP